MRTARHAFTFLEVMVVIVMIGILAAIVVPQFGGITNDAKASALKSSVAGWRSGIAAYRTRQLLAGSTPYPTLAQLTTTGTVVSGDFPANPYNSKSGVQSVTLAQANARTVVNEAAYGWNYYVDNTASPPVAIFYPNSDDAVETVSGATRTANQY
ncbi:MAG: prepilin-type N-terminal cleavage/methylation domain-containing protein [Phycisphaerales bacterium]